MMQINPTTATEWAKEITVVLRTEYPASMHHVRGNRNDCSVVPHKLHPAFWGSFDWHSSVHMQFSAVKLLDIIPSGAIRQDLVQELAGRLNVDAIAVETAYLSEHSGYERPYGWAWALQLAAACKQANFEEATEWFRALVPLAHQVATHFLDWLPQMPLPVRHGVHDNTALSLFLAHEAGKKLGLKDLCERIREVGVSWYLNDQNYPYGWELSAHDFVSGLRPLAWCICSPR
ncbi:hypothetical protein C3B44_04475 [Corynebacterium yudongzhengii]|uniref:DUF2891 domain-containing protein n=1 Tax=Corynebacterium yudongzhengii TaxID=2080740 RepID=A0A2U1T564_9CORY|nr:hypothetical protein C3B44_04475 [Corynebacterium yudongzhengii]PWC01144.1 DUF2891 domain-containing protein [Corynebacterium yudongzhengii]